MNLDEALTYPESATRKPKSGPSWEAGLQVESRLGGHLTKSSITDTQAGRATLGFSFHRSLSAGRRKEIKKPEQYSLKYKYQVLLDGVLEEPWPGCHQRHLCTTIHDSV